MNICIPVTHDKGIDSPVSGHFGSAPFFLIVDSETRACRAVPNGDHGHEHGQCQPLRALAGQAIDGVVVGGIGAGALFKLQAAGTRVYKASALSVGEMIDAFNGGMLAEMTPATACNHGHDHHGPGAHGSGCGGLS